MKSSDLKKGDRITVRVLSKNLTSESISGNTEVPYPWSSKEKRPCKVLDVYPNFIVCECSSRPAFFGPSVHYTVTFDTHSIDIGDILVERRH